jgi:DNA-binding NarL/FixJ family response regulator
MSIAPTLVPHQPRRGNAAVGNNRETHGTVNSLHRTRVVRRRVGPGGLTRREIEVLRLVAQGASNKAVAAVLWVTDQTVKFHLSNIYRKLHVSNRFEASRWARENGVLEVAADEPRRFELFTRSDG